MAKPVFDSSAGTTGTGTSSSAALNHAAKVKVLIVVSYIGTTAPNSLTIGGVSILSNLVTAKVSQSTNMSVSTYWADVAAAANDTIAVGFASSTRHSWSAISLTNAGLGSVNLENIVTANGSGATAQSATATPGAGTTDRLLVGLSGAVQSANATGSLAAAPGNSETERKETELAGSASLRAVGSQIETYDSATSRAVTTTWSKTSATIQWAHVALGVKGEVSPTVALNSPTDASSGSNTTPTLNFTGTDGNGDSLEYEVQICNDSVFPLNISDNFNDNSIDGAKWVASWASSGTIDESGGKIIITPAASSAGDWNNIATINTFDFRGSSAQVKVTQVANGDIETVLHIRKPDESASRYIYQASGNLLVSAWDSGILASIAYNSTTMAYWRICESGGTTYYQYSQTGIAGSWTTLYSEASPDFVASVRIVLETVEPVSNATPGAAWFDDFNIIPSGVFIDALSASDAGFTSGHPFASGSAIDYTVQSSLSAGTYYWRARAIDPSGSNAWGAWSSVRSFTITTGFIIQDANSSSSADNITLSRNGGDLIIQDSGSLASDDNVILIGNFIVQSSVSVSTSDNVVINRNGGDLIISDSNSVSSADNVSLIGNLIIQDSTSLTSADNFTISRNGGDFSVQNAGSPSLADNLTLIGNLVIQNATSASSSDNVILVRNGGDLTIQDSTSLSSVDTPTLISGPGSFVIQDAVSATNADNLGLTRNGGDLIINDAGSTAGADNFSLIGNFLIQDSNSSSSSDNLVLARNGGDFSIDYAASLASADNFSLSIGSGLFEIQNSGSVSSIDNVVIFPPLPDFYKKIILVDTGEIAVWVTSNVYIHAPPH